MEHLKKCTKSNSSNCFIQRKTYFVVSIYDRYFQVGGAEEQLYRNEKFLSKFLPKETSSGQCKTGCIAKQTRPFVNTARFEIELLALTWNRSYTLLRETTSKMFKKPKKKNIMRRH